MLTIRLMGPPGLERDGQPVRPPRGQKSWALLGYLALGDRAPSRPRLAELLFADADDPLAALRWTLSELRRAVGPELSLLGDPVTLSLDADVDLLRVTAANADPALLLQVSGELLEGVEVQGCPEFEAWLMGARHRVTGTLAARLRQHTMALMATGRAKDAVAYASRVVALDPLEEGNHELLVRALAQSGDTAAALRQVASCEDLFDSRLGLRPSPALAAAAASAPGTQSAPPLSGRAAALSQLEAGRAAIMAGAVDAGLQCLRTAVMEAARCHDNALHAKTLAALGGALVHAVRGRDEEGSLVLHEAIQAAQTAGDQDTAVLAYRELGFVEVQAGRRQTADSLLAKAQTLAVHDDALAAILGVRGMNASDQADYPAAFGYLHESVDRAASSADHRQQAWSLSILARAHLLRAERSQAAAAVTQSIQLVQQQRWLAFLPWPQALQAELDLQAGDSESAADNLERAWTLACQLTDPCWEGMAARGLGLLHAGRNEHASATAWLTEATTRSSRDSDRYQWVHGYALDAAISTALDQDDVVRAQPMVDVISSLAARCDMRELVVRAHVHRHRLGDRSALTSARLMASDIDNPALAALLASA
ncbi:hypothetical protein acdb102_05480 [Acidothermaceae bacterium B102]|nr:hypothetical protein acdb102_05480 [Acidothermaceae bacterium B102]